MSSPAALRILSLSQVKCLCLECFTNLSVRHDALCLLETIHMCLAVENMCVDMSI